MELPLRRVERAETPVMFVAVKDGSDEIGPAWDRLETLLGSLRGRTFLGVFDFGIYRCCVQLRAGDDPARLGLQSGVVPGGQYLSATIRGSQPAAYALLTPTFEQLRRSGDRDDTRPSIEYYRRHDRSDLLMPIRDGA
ncbi:GyrI-like domain-containing protein [Micromonospora sp. NPDC005172]|uniref:GyrI-like domain-containing protein n=1 Tax=Micromonospora sp. NPDC005172 TaxID=3156867 RepID=UPI0033AE933D